MESVAQLTKQCGLTSADQLEKFFHEVLDHLLGRGLDFHAEYKTPKGVDIYDAVEECGRVLKTCCSGAGKEEDIKGIRSGTKDANVAKAAAAVFGARYRDLIRLLESSVVDLADTKLLDFDWSLRVAVSSSKAQQLYDPVAMLSLNVADDHGAKKTVLCELNEQQLDDLVRSCDNIETVRETGDNTLTRASTKLGPKQMLSKIDV